MSNELDLRMLGYELEGVLIDVANGGFDKVCLETVKRVREALGAAHKEPSTGPTYYVKHPDGSYSEAEPQP